MQETSCSPAERKRVRRKLEVWPWKARMQEKFAADHSFTVLSALEVAMTRSWEEN